MIPLIDEARALLEARWTRVLAVIGLLALAATALYAGPQAMASSLRVGLSVAVAVSLALRAVARRSVSQSAIALGILVATLAPGESLLGSTQIGGVTAPETVTAGAGLRSAPYHLGGSLYAEAKGGQMHLTLRTGELVAGEATVALDGRSTDEMAGWRWRLASQGLGSEPAVAIIDFKRRDGTGEPVRHALRMGQAVRLPDQTVARVLRLSGDFGKALGAAVWLELEWPTGKEAAWRFVDGPELDARTGIAPWTAVVTRLETGRQATLQVSRRQRPGGAYFGWGLVLLGVLMATASRLRGVQS